MPNLLDTWFCFLFGMSMILFHKFIIRKSLKWGSGIFGLNIFKFKISNKEMELGRPILEIWFLIIGFIFVVFSLLQLFNVIHLRQ